MFGTTDLNNSLAKLQPTDLPVNTLANDHELYTVRNSFYYIYVNNWIDRYRGYLRLSSEYFDVELFEMEILQLFNPPPLDELVLFINKLKVAIVNQLTNSNKLETTDFDHIIKRLFVNTALGDTDSDITFDSLDLVQKFETFYVILDYFSGLANFRTFIDKLDVKASSDIGTTVLKSEVYNGRQQDWILMFNDTKLYKRVIEYPRLEISRKRTLAPADPESYYEGHFDISIDDVLFTAEIWTLPQYQEFVKNIPKNSYFQIFKTEEFQSNILNMEMKKRRLIQNKRKEYQLINLMATRKKSSRLEAKEREKQQVTQQRRLRNETKIKAALQLDTLTKPLTYDTGKLSREERLKFRKLNSNYRSARDSLEPETELDSY